MTTRLESYRVAHSIAIPLTLDESGELFRAFGVKSVPAVLIADGQGRIVRRIEGGEAQLSDELRAATQLPEPVFAEAAPPERGYGGKLHSNAFRDGRKRARTLIESGAFQWLGCRFGRCPFVLGFEGLR